MTDFPQGVRECREPQLGLEELLRHRCQLLQQREEYQVGRHPARRASASCPLARMFPPPTVQQVLAVPAPGLGLRECHGPQEDKELGVFEGLMESIIF